LNKKGSVITHQDQSAAAAIADMRSCIAAIKKDPSLYEEKNFDKRASAIDQIEFRVIEQLEVLLQKTAQPDKLIVLKNRAEKIKAELEEIDINLFKKLRAGIRTGKYTGRAFKNMVGRYVDFDLDDKEHQEEAGYDNLDSFINGLFPSRDMPEQTKDLEPEMVYYQKTPGRIVFELAEKAHFADDDVFYDLGSGLGQVAILVNLLTGVTAKGVEFEPALTGLVPGRSLYKAGCLLQARRLIIFISWLFLAVYKNAAAASLAQRNSWCAHVSSFQLPTGFLIAS
jgi:hypothetical protein